MYDRAPRTLTGVQGCTAQHVGPGTYDQEVTGAKNLRTDGYAPFLSMTSRDSALNPNDTVIAAPGPGQYDPTYPQDVITGGKTLGNKCKRFKEDFARDNPGPGSYNLSKKGDWIKEARQSSSAPGEMDTSKRGGMMMTSRIKFHRQPIAPSIPTPGQSYGYEEKDDGTLRKQDPPNKDASMGPAFYNVAYDDTKTTAIYKGIHFGKLTSHRNDFTGKAGPGPGEYEPYKQPTNQAEHANLTEEDKTKMDARLPRYHELVVKEEEKKAVPGPGKYEVKGQFDRSTPKVNTEGMEIEHPPFGSQAKRFGLLKGENPSPGSYNDPRTALEILKKVTGLKRSPFGQTSVRFQPGVQIKKAPGPGSYNIAGMGSDSMRRAYVESTRRGVFGTTSVRIAPMLKRSEPELPGPAHYQVKEKPFKPRYQQLTSNFASLSTRLSDAAPAVKEIPPPGSYEVGKAYTKTQGKIVPSGPRTRSGKLKQGAFQSSSSRFAPPRDVVLAESDPANPGPGTYEPKLRSNHGNPLVAKQNRFTDLTKDDIPGPGQYEFSPLVQDTVLKGTFNATLNNPIARQVVETVHKGAVTNHPFLLGV